jgi:hypothetical protein
MIYQPAPTLGAVQVPHGVRRPRDGGTPTARQRRGLRVDGENRVLRAESPSIRAFASSLAHFTSRMRHGAHAL